MPSETALLTSAANLTRAARRNSQSTNCDIEHSAPFSGRRASRCGHSAQEADDQLRLGAARDQAIRECSIAAANYIEHVRANWDIQTYRPLMSEVVAHSPRSPPSPVRRPTTAGAFSLFC
jgi:hypothetical protein